MVEKMNRAQQASKPSTKEILEQRLNRLDKCPKCKETFDKVTIAQSSTIGGSVLDQLPHKYCFIPIQKGILAIFFHQREELSDDATSIELNED